MQVNKTNLVEYLEKEKTRHKGSAKWYSERGNDNMYNYLLGKIAQIDDIIEELKENNI